MKCYHHCFQKISLAFLFVVSFSTVWAQGVALEWVRTYGNSGQELGYVMNDLAGNIYHLGYFSGTVDLDPGPGMANFVSNGSNDISIQKFDALGNLIWAKTMGGTASDVPCEKFVIDSSGNVIVGGHFEGTVDFDPGAGVFNLTSATLRDVFVLMLDSTGNFLWAKKIGGSNADELLAIRLDPSGNLLLAGEFIGTSDFDPGPGTFMMTAPSGAYDVFVCKLSSAGNFIWAKRFGGNTIDQVRSLIPDNSGNIYVAGMFDGTGDYDPGPGTTTLTSTGSADVSLIKINSAGDLIWAKQIGGSLRQLPWGITIDSSDNFYVAGYFEGTADFDPNAGVHNLTAVGDHDGFVVKYTSAGNLVWAGAFGNVNLDIAYAVEFRAPDKLIYAGSFSGAVDFDLSPATSFTQTAVGLKDIFVSQIDTAGNFEWAKQISGPDDEIAFSICNDGGDIILSGGFKGTVDFDPGAGTYAVTSAGDFDVSIVKLSVCTGSSFALSASACDSFTLNAQTYTQSGTYTQVLTNVAGCDSVITLSLTIHPPAIGVLILSACDTVDVNGQVYTQSGTYTQSLTSVAGCDSTLTINLTLTLVQADIFMTGPSLQTSASGSYQWFDCTSQQILAGDTLNIFTPLASGNYAVIVTQSGCADTSQCMLATAVKNDVQSQLQASPNPTKGYLLIQQNVLFEPTPYEVYAMDGRCVLEGIFDPQLPEMDLTMISNGIYMVRIEGQVVRVMKE